SRDILAVGRDSTRCRWPGHRAHRGDASYFPKFPAVSRRKRSRLENMESMGAFFPRKALIFQWKKFFTRPWKIKTPYFPERNQSAPKTGLENMEIMRSRPAAVRRGGATEGSETELVARARRLIVVEMHIVAAQTRRSEEGRGG